MIDKEVVKSKESKINELSENIFNKKAKDIKYLYVTNYIHRQLLEEEITRTGLYQWLNVFNGEIHYPREVLDYEKYDIVQVNMSTQDIHLVGNIHEQLGKNSQTKLVVNNDYTTELWGRSFDFPSTIKREISGADMLFGTEYFMTSAVSELAGRKCYVIPHPADIKRLKSLPTKPVKNLITSIWRRYDNFSYVPYLVVRNQGLTTQLIGYDKSIDPKVFLTTALYDYVLQGTNYFEFCNQLRESKVVYDPFTLHSYSRAGVDCAALGVPVVGSNRNQSINNCYPFTSIDPYDVTNGRKLIRKILDDEQFRQKVVDTAREKSEFYNHINSRERYLTALDESLNSKKSEITSRVERKDLARGIGADVLSLRADEITKKS